MAKAQRVHNVQASLLAALGGEAKLLDISTLNFDPKNPNTHPEKNIEAIKHSLEEFGQDQLIVVQKEGMIVRKGNGRLQAAKELGWTHIAGVIIDETEINSIARGLADNRTSELSQWNEEILSSVIAQLVEADVDATLLGWDEDELYSMLQGDDDTPEADGDIDLPDPVDNKTDFVIFRFGDYKGYINRETYDSFKELYESKRDSSGQVQLDDVIRHCPRS